MFRSLLSAAILAAALSLAAPALADSIDFGRGPLTIHPPSDFVDSRTLPGDLFEETRRQAGPQVSLLKLYLPEVAARNYGEGRPDAVTRQVALYSWPEGAPLAADRKSLELAAGILEGAWAGYPAVPEEDLRNPDALADRCREALEEGTPLRVETDQTENAVTFVLLQNYAMTPGAERRPAFLTTALATSLVLVNDAIVFVTASSIVTDAHPADHVAWVKSAAEIFSDTLLSAAKN